MTPLRYAPHPNAAWRMLADVVVAITPDNRQHELSGPVELFVWQALADGGRSADELAQGVVQRFDVEAGQARADLDAFLAQLLAAGLVSAL